MKNSGSHTRAITVHHIWAVSSRSCGSRPDDPVFNCSWWTMDWVCWVVAEDLISEQAYDFLFETAICALFSSWSRNRVQRSKLHWASPQLPWGMQRFFGAFVLETTAVSSCLWRDFCQKQCVLRSFFYLEPGLKSREEMQQICGLLVLSRDYLYAFRKTLCPVTLTLSWDRCILWKSFTSHTSPHFYVFHTFYSTPIFSYI